MWLKKLDFKRYINKEVWRFYLGEQILSLLFKIKFIGILLFNNGLILYMMILESIQGGNDEKRFQKAWCMLLGLPL